MFRHRHFIYKQYVDKKTLLKEEKYKRINREWLNYTVWLKV